VVREVQYMSRRGVILCVIIRPAAYAIRIADWIVRSAGSVLACPGVHLIHLSCESAVDAIAVRIKLPDLGSLMVPPFGAQIHRAPGALPSSRSPYLIKVSKCTTYKVSTV
jgi:hypothetical protein